MKKVLAIVLCLVLGLFMAACGSSSSDTPASTEQPASTDSAASGESSGEAQESYKFAFIYTAVHYFWDGVGVGATDFAEEMKAQGINIDVYTAAPTNGSAAEQLQIFEDCVSQGYDAIGIAALDPDALKPAIQAAVEKGVTVITFDTDVPDSGRLCFVGSDNYDFGCLMAKTAAEILEGKGTVIIENGIATQLGMVQRLQGVEDTFKEYPEIEILQVESHLGDTTKAMSDVENMVGKYPDFDMLLYLDAGGENAVNVFKANNWTTKDHFAVLSDDLIPVIQAVKDGTVNATIVQGQYNWGYVGSQILLDAIHGKMPTEDFINTGVYAVDADRAVQDYPDY